MGRGGTGIFYYSDKDRYRLRVHRKGVTHYLGMFPTYEMALMIRQEFLERTNGGKTLPDPEPEPYTYEWYKRNKQNKNKQDT